MMKIHQSGVLIIGAPRTGKSKLALELLDRGHQLVSDDAVEITRQDQHLFAHSQALINRFLYVAQFGVFDVQQLFGAQALITQQEIHLVLELIPAGDNLSHHSLSGNIQAFTLVDIPVDKLVIHVQSASSSLSILVEKFVLQWQYNQNNTPAYQALSQQQILYRENLC